MDRPPTAAMTAVKYSGTFFAVKTENRIRAAPKSTPITPAIVITADIEKHPFTPRVCRPPCGRRPLPVLFEVQLVFHKIVRYKE